ncbi:MAG: hypothetical protein ACK46J_08645, partial [Burkholderiales bacterium]
MQKSKADVRAADKALDERAKNTDSHADGARKDLQQSAENAAMWIGITSDFRHARRRARHSCQVHVEMAQRGGKRSSQHQSVATASSEIAQGNSGLSSRTENQAANLQQTAATIKQLTATVKQSATTAQRASTLAVGATEAAETGGK